MNVEDGSPAYNAGIKGGESVNGRSVELGGCNIKNIKDRRSDCQQLQAIDVTLAAIHLNKLRSNSS
jgi:predicted metalloprotease with PDZ domain